MKIALLGDVAFFGKNTVDNPEIFNYLKEASDLLNSFDLVVANLEAPFCEGIKPLAGKSASICSDRENIKLLKYLNVSMVSLANNHIFDYGIRGLEQTITALDESGIKYFGVNNKCVSDDDNKIVFSGFCCYSSNPLGAFKGPVDELSYDTIEKKVAATNYLNVFGVHAGLEHVNYPSYDHINLARDISQRSNCVYWGHHPHVLQGIEEVNDSLIAYSLGNFIFDDVYTPKSDKPLVIQSENNKTSVILVLEVEDGKLLSWDTIGIYMGEKQLQVYYDPAIENLTKYSNFLNEDKVAYVQKRSSLLNDYVEKRKEMRDLQWYLKRCNLSSVKMLVNARKNTKLYNRKVLRNIK